MKVYEVECRAVITLAAEDVQKAALYGAAAIKDNPHLIYVRAVHERNFEVAFLPSPRAAATLAGLAAVEPRLWDKRF